MKKFLFALMASAAIFAACDDSQSLLSSAKISVPDTMEELFTNGVTLDASAQDIDVKFTANSTWTIEFSCDTPDGVNWVYADPARGDGGDVEMKVSVTANESEMSRTATATVTCYSVTGDVTRSFTITQEGKKAAQTGGLTIDPDKVTVLKNEKFHLTAKDASGNPVKATWSSGDTMVARVDNNGDVQAINPGSTVITAEADGKTGTCEVTVTDEIPVESIAFDPESIEMNVGEQRQLTVVFTPANATNKTINVWTVDGGNPNVTVDNNGVVTAVSKGNAVVVAAINKDLIARCSIKINDPNNPDIPVESITLDKTEATVYTKQEEPLILTATVTPAEALNGKSIQWKSEDPTTVMVQSIDATRAKVTGVKAGKTSVSAHLGDKSASCVVTVEEKTTGGGDAAITLNKTEVHLGFYETAQLVATFNSADIPADATVTWSSSNEDFVIVSNGSTPGADGSIMPAGMIMAKNKAGQATVTATVGDKYASCEVYVEGTTGTPVQSITLNKTKLEMTVGQKEQLTFTVQPASATYVDNDFEWTSSDVYKVYVNGGLVTATKVCENVTITVTYRSNREVSASCVVTVKEAGAGGETGDEAVDLGLPSGLKWRSMNVGASKPEDYGNYYAWGETETKESYIWNNYKYRSADSYSDRSPVLTSGDDAATVNVGSGWRTPKISEWKELKDNCTWTWTTRNGVNGMLVTGSNGNSIFLPAAGCFKSSLTNGGTVGYYWSASYYSDTWAQSLEFMRTDATYGLVDRSAGYSIRPVKD